jgi:Family of unknown function (DUF6455)
MGLSAIIHRWWQRQLRLRELDALGRDECQAVARDVGVRREALYRLVTRDEGEGLLPRLLRVLGLDPEGLAHSRQPVMRDMAVVCSGCSQTGRCQRELTQRSAWRRYQQYCPNAATIDSL